MVTWQRIELIFLLIAFKYVTSSPFLQDEPAHVEQILNEIEDDEEESGEAQLVEIKNIFANRLKITNFSRPALAERAGEIVVEFLIGTTTTTTSTTPQPFIEEDPEPIPPPFPPPSETESRTVFEVDTSFLIKNPDGSFVITLPQLMMLTMMMNGSKMAQPLGAALGTTIEIELPNPSSSMAELRQSLDEEMASSPMMEGSDPMDASNIEAAILEALVVAQMQNMSSATTKTRVGGVKRRPGRPGTSAVIEKAPLLPLQPLVDRITDVLKDGKIASFVWNNVMRLTGTKYVRIAADAVGCQVFYDCPNDNELGMHIAS